MAETKIIVHKLTRPAEWSEGRKGSVVTGHTTTTRTDHFDAEETPEPEEE
jgi:hypothetical protein